LWHWRVSDWQCNPVAIDDKHGILDIHGIRFDLFWAGSRAIDRLQIASRTNC
jgi:hypothetical protein